MVNFKQFSAVMATVAGLTVASAAVVAPAQAFTVTPSSITDDDFRSLLTQGDFSELFVAESRMGNNGNSGDRELGINDALVPDGNGGFKGAAPLDEGQRVWQSGLAVAFELSYDALTSQIAYKVGGQTLEASIAPSSPDSIFLRTRAQGKKNTVSSALTLQNLMLDEGNGFQTINAGLSSSATGAGKDVDYLIISGLVGSFTLKGEQIFDWEGQLPTGSRLATQLKVGVSSEAEAVPEPLTILGTLAAGGLGYGMKRRRGSQIAENA
ncbi:MAG: PEP-CTERM sorting domain-containing protein [Leptolyngbyaceae cyanobacterium]